MQFDLGAEIVRALPRLRRFALSLCRNVDEADDLVQSTCDRALRAEGSFTPGTRVDAWLFRILRNLWLDRIRRRRHRGEEIDVEEVVDLVDPHGERPAEWRLLLDRVWPAIGELSADQREVILLVCVEELSYQEAAVILDVPVGTVMSRLSRARRKLAEGLGMQDGLGRCP
jgi:RNA polymerase sigma-70 factor, ECF subfamily